MIASLFPVRLAQRPSLGMQSSSAVCGLLALCLCCLLPETTPSVLGQDAAPLVETGQIEIAGKETSYRIRHLPVTSFPELPDSIATALRTRGCLIPQTYEAFHPENVIRASFERAGSTDWAVLCSAGGKVSLLVFLASGSAANPSVLATAAETSRLQMHDPSGELGFNWGIDAATPAQVHDGQAGMEHRPPPPEHDCVADSVIDRRTAYRCYRNGAWMKLDTE